ncbi:thiol-disulfide isomerase/thioredoxin [Pedobacter cryoconitis]|uniref:Thiol-disulfide isomerase/thioredoxin n=1 Tax=Pedobacter cryoconitis TaxID=188932 RepID=A0A7W9E1F2_9SPHI|nr:TlpA disulfide reductase family protein [Pedobacter cryoconitis]MBB5639036.1 thiol-disulfide isomerase/thioredoxin [Pedobacter cryoconitis]
MKKITINIVMAMLCLIFNSYAQQNKVADPKGNGLQIGQKIPDVMLKNIHNYKAKTAKISDFEGKLLILDFWATWCSPCIAMLPKMDLMQRKFDGKLQFLSVTYQAEKEIIPFLTRFTEKQKAGFTIPSVIEDHDLNLLFPHQQLPHYVWIGPDGIVQAITSDEEINEANITASLSGKTMKKLAVKVDMVSKAPYDREKPLLINNNGGDGQNLIYHSIFAGFSENLGGGGSSGVITSEKGKQLVIFNSSIPWFYKDAYGDGTMKFSNNNRVRFEVRELDKLICGMEGAPALEWMKKGNVFSYELFVPNYMSDQLFQLMKEDLKRIFPQYTAKVELLKVKCMALTRTNRVDKIKTKDPLAKPAIDFNPAGMKLVNVPISAFVDQMQSFYQQSYPMPIIDETQYKDKVDLLIKSSLGNMDDVNAALREYGLEFKEVERKIEMLVISDTKGKPGSDKKEGKKLVN